MPAHLARQRRAGFLHLRLDQAATRLPHQRFPAEFGDAVEQRLAGLDVGDDGRAGPLVQHRGGIDLEQLVAPDHPALAVDRPDTVAVSIESDAEIEALLRDQLPQIGQIRLDRGIGMVVRKMAVDISVEKMMLAGQPRGELFDDGARGAVAGVPADAEGAAGEALDEPVDIGVDDVDALRRSLAAFPVARGSDFADPLNVGAEEGAPLKHHLEAVIVGGIVAAGYLYAAVHILG